LWIVAASGCAAPSKPFALSRWGSLREVLHDGKTEAKVRLADVCRSSATVGIGAVAELDGEILILDGEPFVSSVAADGKPTTRTGSSAHVGAAMLVVADVPHWKTVRLDQPVDTAEFDKTIRDAAVGAGVDMHSPFPFVLSGSASALEGHVMHGACPEMGSADESKQPYRLKWTEGREVTLVGIYAENAAGVITHHDSNTHIHALMRGTEPEVAHVERVSFRAGASVRFPTRE